MILIKWCPRCNGDKIEEELLGEMERVCLHCGHRAYPETIARQHPGAPVFRRQEGGLAHGQVGSQWTISSSH